MHSLLSNEEQKRVFFPCSQSNKTKVIISTNVAETSVTIDDVGLVIDTGMFKESTYNPMSHFWALKEEQISRSSMIQRRGRAGRTGPGRCYHLYEVSDIKLDFPIPGMLKDSLEEAIILFKSIRGNSNSYSFFSKALNPPLNRNITIILEDLVDLGVVRGKFNELELSDDTELTPLGFHLVRLGTNVRVGKLLLFGIFFHCIDPILTICSVLDGKNPFKQNYLGGNYHRSNIITTPVVRKHFGNDDFTAILEARSVFLTKTDLRIKYLSHIAMKTNEMIRNDFIRDLLNSGFLKTSPEPLRKLDVTLLKICLAAGLFPYIGFIKQSGEIVTGPHDLKTSTFDDSSLFQPTLSFTYFVYHERVMVEHKLKIRRGIAVSPIALVLFGGGFGRLPKKQIKSRFISIKVGNCWILHARIKDAFLVCQLRRLLDETLLKIYENNRISSEDEKLFKLIHMIIESSNNDNEMTVI